MCPPTPDRRARLKRGDPTTAPNGASVVETPKMNGNKASESAAVKGGFPIVTFSPLSLFVLLLGCAAASFSVGLVSRTLILSHFFGSTRSETGIQTLPTDVPSIAVREAKRANFPGIPVTTGKKAPNNTYTFKQFETSSGIRSNSILLDGQCEVASDGSCRLPAAAFSETDGAEPKNDTAAHDMHEPSGQHLLVDIENVDAVFLNSEELLATAMIDLIMQSSIDLLSYHCHSLPPVGVSCVGILVGSHVSLHTWPVEGVITFDLFSCSPSSLLPLLPTIKELFGVPRAPPAEEELFGKAKQFIEEPRMVWSHKQRGFRKAAQYNLVDADVHWILGIMHLVKQHVATVKTNYQLIDIYDLVDPRFGGIDRVVFLDGIIQSRSLGEHAYHEALVHPALFAHDNPRRVVIIGAGEGATLREVLKHNTVEEVIMVEIDEGMVDTSKKYLPEWSYCGNLVGSAASCFDDPRAKVYYTDAIAWFIERFGSNATIAEGDSFDVIIMDALDPNSVVEFSDLLYNNNELMEAFSRALGENGIFVAQVGEMDEIDDPPKSLYPKDHFVSFVNGLENFGFDSIIDYAEAHGRLVEIWSFLLAMKDSGSRANWFMSEAEMNLKISKRSMRTKNGESPFLFFDGASMMQYQFAARVVEEVWCRDRVDECASGHGYDPEISNVPSSSFKVGPSVIAKGGRGVFATEFVPKGSLIGLEECVNGMFVPSTTFNLMREAADEIDESVSEFWNVVFWGYIDGYGWLDHAYGPPAGGVDPGIMTFVNHGCKGAYNVGTRLELNEMTMELGRGPGEVYDDEKEVYHPYAERHYPQWDCQSFVALRDIDAGEELFDNYLVFGGSEDLNDWDKNLRELKNLCSGGTGSVAEYEEKAAKDLTTFG